MTILLIADHVHTALKDATQRALTAAKALQDQVHVLVAGHNCQSAAQEASRLDGVGKVICVDDVALANHLAEPMSQLIASFASRYATFVMPATSLGKGVMPRVAAMLDVMQISDVLAVIDQNTFDRPIYAGNAIQRVKTNERYRVLTVRTSVFEPSGLQMQAAPIENFTPSVPLAQTLSRFINDEIVVSERPELASAKVVVSGGRALGSQENFDKLIAPLADVLKAATGASRAAVDAGYAPNDWQVGQTGKVVAPQLYIAIGISGAIQHLAGMKDAKIIVAINKDGDAPIFQVSDFGLVGDLFAIIPELTQKLAAKKAQIK
jgi:electron transfer flavoprotein alpha subunit